MSPQNMVNHTAELRGLTQHEVAKKIAKGQVNKVEKFTTRTIPQILISNIFSAFNGILAISLLALLLIRANLDAVFLFAVTFFNTLTGISEEIRAKIALDRLAFFNRKKVFVVRDKEKQEIAIEEVVKDDLIICETGQQIIADGILLSEKPIYVDESLLTGESDNIKKEHGNDLFSGSFCVSGSGIYQAVKVGVSSNINLLAAQAKKYKKTLSPLQKSINIIVEILTSTMILFIVLLLIAGYIKKSSLTSDILAIVTVIKSLVPQGLILMSTLSFAFSAIKVAKKNILVQKLSAIESMSHLTTLCLDKTGTLGTNKLKFHALQLCSQNNDKPETTRKLQLFLGALSDKNKSIHAIEEEFPGKSIIPTDERPFSSHTKISAVQLFDKKNAEEISLWLGAPEILAKHKTFSEEEKNSLDDLRSKGLRVLLFSESKKPLKNNNTFSHLTHLAFIVLEEELRPNIKEAIRFYENRDVKLKILSGDHPKTVAAIAKLANVDCYGELVTGEELENLSPEEFKKKINKGQFFGRLTPKQKKQIIKCLQEQKEFVGMIGDGINDVLALKQADIGIALHSGAEVSRDVSDVILLKDSFTHLPALSKEGDRIIYNIRRIARLFLTKNVYSLFFILFIGFIGLTFPLTPRFITWIDMLTIGVPATFLMLMAPNLPKQSTKHFISDTLRFALISGVIISFLSMLVYAFFYLFLHHPEPFDKTVSASVIIIMDLFLLFYVTKIERKTNKNNIRLIIYGIVLAAFLTNVLGIYLPFVRDLIGLTYVNISSWPIIIGASLLGIIILNFVLRRAEL